jgi:uncharacterized protein (TIGR03089 family)
MGLFVGAARAPHYAAPVTPSEMLRRALAADAARPFVTFYDDATGERVELSVATFDNWVAKTANLFQDGLAAGPGERVAVLLPAHWQTLVVLSAAASAGLVAVPGGDPAAADHVVAGPDGLERARACRGERVALSLRPLGGRFPSPPEGFADYAAEVSGYGDRFVPYAPVPATAPALELGGRAYTAAELGEEAEHAVAERALRAGARLLTDLSPSTWDGLLAGLLLPLATGGSVVLCRNLDPDSVDAKVNSERVTDVIRTTPGGGLSVS